MSIEKRDDRIPVSQIPPHTLVEVTPKKGPSFFARILFSRNGGFPQTKNRQVEVQDLTAARRGRFTRRFLGGGTRVKPIENPRIK